MTIFWATNVVSLSICGFDLELSPDRIHWNSCFILCHMCTALCCFVASHVYYELSRAKVMLKSNPYIHPSIGQWNTTCRDGFLLGVPFKICYRFSDSDIFHLISVSWNYGLHISEEMGASGMGWTLGITLLWFWNWIVISGCEVEPLSIHHKSFGHLRSTGGLLSQF